MEQTFWGEMWFFWVRFGWHGGVCQSPGLMSEGKASSALRIRKTAPLSHTHRRLQNPILRWSRAMLQFLRADSRSSKMAPGIVPGPNQLAPGFEQVARRRGQGRQGQGRALQDPRRPGGDRSPNPRRTRFVVAVATRPQNEEPMRQGKQRA